MCFGGVPLPSTIEEPTPVKQNKRSKTEKSNAYIQNSGLSWII